MLVVAAASVVAMFVDPRIITGAPAWLRPFKLAVSIAVYSLTLAWMFGWLPDWPQGDLRVPHFIGLHAIQALALVAVGLRRWRAPVAVRVGAVLAAAASYRSLFVLLLWEALRGHSVV
jgi:hypothetical protein